MSDPKAFVIPIRSGEHSTEHGRAWRAEAVGIALVVAGLVLAAMVGWQGIALCAVGALLVGWNATAYFRSRGEVKSAAVRRPADQATRS